MNILYNAILFYAKIMPRELTLIPTMPIMKTTTLWKLFDMDPWKSITTTDVEDVRNGDFHQTVCVTSLCKESPVACKYEESNKFSLQNGVLYRNIVLNKQNVRQLVLTASFRLITFRDINFDTPMQAIMEGTELYIRWER